MDRLSRLGAWGRSILLSGGAQLGVQGLGFVAGVMVVRGLSAREYAYYTIANSALGAMNVLADGGVSSGAMAIGGRAWQDRRWLGQVLASGLALRRKFSLYAVALAIPATVGLLYHQGADLLSALLISVAILPLFLFTVTGQLLEIVPRLHQHLGPLQRVQLMVNGGRVALLAAMLNLVPVAAPVLLAAALPQWWGNWRLRRLVSTFADRSVDQDPQVRQELVVQVRRAMPNAVYYAFSGQITVWLISMFGGATSVAAVGALGRLAVVMSVLGTIFSVVAVPRLARIPWDDPARIRRRYWQSQGLLLAACGVPIALVGAFPGPILGILGPAYAGLSHEAVLMVASSAVAVMTGASFSLGTMRGIIAPAWFAIPLSIASQVALIATLPMSTVSGVLWLGLISVLCQWFLHTGYFVYRMRQRP